MKIKNLTQSEAQSRLDEIKVRLFEISDSIEREERAQTAEEIAEVARLEREANDIKLSLAVAAMPSAPMQTISRERGFDNYVRDVKKNRQLDEQVMAREVMATTDLNGVAPLTISDIIKPLEEGLILNTVGLKLQTGLTGDYVSPIVGRLEAEFKGESVELADKKVDINALRPVPARLGVSVSVTSQMVNKSQGLILDIVREQIPLAITRTLNKAMFSPEATENGVSGPFAAILKKSASGQPLTALKGKAAKKAATHIKFASALPTYKELVAMKGIVLAKGVINDGTAAYVMSEYMKATLESTPRDAGSGLMIIENGRIAGVPVFCTNDIDTDSADYIGFGVWSYCLLGQFGDMRFVVDPVSQAKKDLVVMTLNGDWAMTVARDEAFLLGSGATAE
ncbi:MAG: phage major capsid protein [Alistipes sp.]|nr:phage major capsid protein [Alistipes sp.]